MRLLLARYANFDLDKGQSSGRLFFNKKSIVKAFSIKPNAGRCRNQASVV